MTEPRKPKLAQPVTPKQTSLTTNNLWAQLEGDLKVLSQKEGETAQAAMEMLHWMEANHGALIALSEAQSVQAANSENAEDSDLARLALALWQSQRQELLGSVVALAHTQVMLSSGAHQAAIFGLDLQEEGDTYCLYAPLESTNPTWH